MNVNSCRMKTVSLEHKTCLMVFIIGITLLSWSAVKASAQSDWPKVACSKDGTPIAYEVYGQGEPTLVFVHGWSCDGRYWRNQVPYFSKKNRVIIPDLAGHGHSGLGRKRYTMQAFGEDVQAVVDAESVNRVILIGHSMGGSVVAEAAKRMPGRVAGLIGVDTLDNIEYPLTRREFKEMIEPLKKDFKTGSRAFIGAMIKPDTDPVLRDWILADMSAAPPGVALSAMNEMMTPYITGAAAKVFEEIRVPVVCVNGDLWPVNYEANRRHMVSFDAIVLPGADHFLMMNQPDKFNPALEKAVQMILKKPVE